MNLVLAWRGARLDASKIPKEMSARRYHHDEILVPDKSPSVKPSILISTLFTFIYLKVKTPSFILSKMRSN